MTTNPGSLSQLGWSSEFLDLVRDLTCEQSMTTENHRASYPWIYDWPPSLATVIHDLLDPQSELAANQPRLHEILVRRYSASMKARQEDREVSKCSHLFTNGEHRTDSYEYQYHIHAHGSTVADHDGNLAAAITYYANLCPDIKDNFVIRGILGIGSYGAVFLAHKSEDKSNKLYAIKVEPLTTINASVNPVPYYGNPPSLAPLYYPEDLRLRYIPIEAFILLLVNGFDRFLKLDSVYSHQNFSAMVMEAQIDQEAQSRPYDPSGSIHDWLKEAKNQAVCNGAKLINRKQTSLNEIQACKVASHLFEAIAYLHDMGICNTDLSHGNYLVDEQLNTRMIDLGLLHFGVNDQDFSMHKTAYIPSYERSMTPELAIELTKSHWLRKFENQVEASVDIPHDVRQLTCWQLATIIYELLHGFAPWEEKEWDELIGGITEYMAHGIDYRRLGKVRERRGRIINEDLPISENLSQDCVDALRMMFVKNPEERPSIEMMATFPWFGQWTSHSPEEFQRPPFPPS
ncbi:kinase-like protein [Aspergillus sclerotioniger CBS 115572]|uniref:Kinase-like protein n=1 Tax=Aspergillus sclerotioniger CBS 115572 TaxID=1450535 RepID=A0A317X6E6_9EURO|nr:kinase-like protein [Aspergillus sclerotioniger CBS 115572]PWY94153.1 kinase-like protein [Aspergillus sclerotioniger CBS 115572]